MPDFLAALNQTLNTQTKQHAASLPQLVAHMSLLMPLFDTIATVVFFIKDNKARYVLVNQTLKQRLAIHHDEDILGRTSEELFGSHQGKEYLIQDFKVLQGNPISDKLELHLYPSGRLGWCITHKIPIYSLTGDILAMAGVSMDIDKDSSHLLRHHEKLAVVVAYIQDNLEQKLSVADLAKQAGLSISRLERLFKSVLHLSPLQMIQKIRLEHAITLLKDSSLSIVQIAGQCGYSDHSAFSRQFKQLTGQSPKDFRERISNH